MFLSGNTGIDIMLLCQSHRLLDHTTFPANNTSFYHLCRLVMVNKKVVINFEKLCEISSNADRSQAAFFRLSAVGAATTLTRMTTVPVVTWLFTNLVH